MTKNIIESCIFNTATFILLVSIAHADEPSRIKSLDRMTYTINPKIKEEKKRINVIFTSLCTVALKRRRERMITEFVRKNIM